MATLYLGAALGVAAVLTGLWVGTRHAWLWSMGVQPDSKAGWVYFLSGPDTAIKVGTTRRDPTADRLPEIRTMSPVPLRIIFKFRAPDAYTAEQAVHEQLAQFRLHGEWFDRDATLAFIDHLRGAYEPGGEGAATPAPSP